MGRSKRKKKRQPRPQRKRLIRLMPVVGVLLVIAVGVGAWLSRRESAPGSGQDNLILITIDTLRADHLGSYGYARDTSPRIDRLAREGTLFTQAAVQWPKTSSSIASMMTSTYCAVNGCQRLRVRLDDRLLMLAEVLRDAGFYTGAFVANVNIATYFNFTQGFHEVHEMWDTSQGVQTDNALATFLSNEDIASRVAAWLRQHHRRRFFLWVHLLDPHGPYLPPASLAPRFTRDEMFTQQNHSPPWGRVPKYQRVEHLKTVGDFVAAYDAEIVSSDAAVGTILDAIDALGLRDRSLVILTADHGESLGEHNYWFNHGKYTYEVCTRVPLVFRHPKRIPAGLRIDTPVELLDLVPTVLDLLNVRFAEPIRQFQGRSLRPLLSGEPVPPRPVFIESRDGQRAVRSGRWKFIFDPRKSTPAYPVVAREQLYDLEADPMETRNVIAQYPEVADELRRLLIDWARRMREAGREFRGRPVPDQTLDPALLERLRSLGYVGDQHENSNGSP